MIRLFLMPLVGEFYIVCFLIECTGKVGDILVVISCIVACERGLGLVEVISCALLFLLLFFEGVLAAELLFTQLPLPLELELLPSL